MFLVEPSPEPDEPRGSLGDRAVSDLGFIRSTIERSGRFTAVSGWGAVFMGAVGLAAAVVSSRSESREAWLSTWLVAAGVALVGGAWAMWRKAAAQDLPLFSGVGRKFLLGLSPGLGAGAAMTFVLARAELYDALPATWLLLFGAGSPGAVDRRGLHGPGNHRHSRPAVVGHSAPGAGFRRASRDRWFLDSEATWRLNEERRSPLPSAGYLVSRWVTPASTSSFTSNCGSAS